MKYDGTNLGILACIFQFVQPEELEKYIRSKPKGKYTRRLWFFYEMLTGKKLDIDDLQTGGYVDALEPEEYYTNSKPQQIRRQRINDNLLGDVRFCPVIRKTEKLQSFEKSNLSEQCRKIITAYPSQLLKRAMSYLYTKETKSSFEIEHVKPNSTRTERFVALLQSAGTEDYCNKNKLLDLQNRVVDLRFQDTDYRNTQNYIGESIGWQRERVHYVPPRPEILTDLMDGLYTANKRMNNGNVSAVIHASAISFGFVFLHPFEDGNGRIHRFLLHNILLRRGFTPSGVIFPLSASMLKNKDDYDTTLELFSRPLMQLVKYKIDNEGRLTVTNKNTTLTDCWYRYMDLTAQTETLFQFIEQTLDSELSNELTFIANYDQAKQSIQNIIDMPDKLIDLFIHSCRQNKDRLSARKRSSHFDFLTDDEIHRLESAVSQAFSVSSFSTES
ncbi:MAG: Fic family protein [Planctomycetaceae bacterium]|nr:Fic family protein [Planctomycetaceae bacterium]